MKKLLTIVITAIIMMQFVLPVKAEGETLIVYVSPTGSDETGTGSPSAPYLTLTKAIEVTRKFTGNKRIRMYGGRYRFSKYVTLNKNDNGLIIENVYGETPEITGADSIPYSAFTKCTDQAILSRIVEYTGRENLMQVYLPDLGITNYGKLYQAGHGITSNYYGPPLTFNDSYLTLGEYPNKGWLYTAQILTENTKNVKFTVNNPRYQKWGQAKDLWILGYLKHDWADVINSASLDMETGVFSSYSNYQAEPNRRVRFFNLLEEIDTPGEYYIDRETGYLYIYLPKEMKEGDELRFSSYSSYFMYLTSAQNVTIQGIKFSGNTRAGIFMSGGSGNTINACEFTATGNYAIYTTSKNTTISNCYFHDIGGGGVYAEAGSISSLTPGNIVVENCRFERFMEYRRTYMAGVYMGGVGQRVSHCEFSDAPHEAIGYRGNNNIIEYCDFENVCNDSADCGAIYTGRDWSTQGHHIRYNYFHDMSLIKTNTGMKSHSVYLDDTHSSTKVYGNVFYKASSVALYGGGRYNTFVNNLMLECDEPFYFDNRGMWWTSSWLQETTSDSLFRKLKQYKYNTGVWLEQYPYLANILEDEPLIPKHNVITGNVIYKTPQYNFAQEVYDYGTVKDNITVENTNSFEDYRNGNFNVLPNSEIMQKIPGFDVVDVRDTGTYPYTLNNRSATPSVSEVSVSGEDTLSASYKFEGYGYYEGNKTSATWLASDTLNGEYKKIATGFSLKVTDDIVGKYVKVQVTPVNNEGVSGTSASSQPVIAGRPANSEALKVTITNEVYTFVNNWSKPLTLGIFSPEYKETNGVREMTSLKISFVTVNNETTAEISKTDIAVTMDNLEPIK